VRAHRSHSIAKGCHKGSSIAVRKCEQTRGGAIGSVKWGDFLKPEWLNTIN
jgi:hypothetical protein